MDDWSNMNPDMEGKTEPPKKDKQDEDISPVRLSKKKVGVFIIVVLVFGMILIAVLQSCSVQKEVNVTTPSPTPEITISDTSKNSGNTGEKESEFSENTVEIEDSSSSRGENSNSEVNSNAQPTDELKESDDVETTPNVTKVPDSDQEVSNTGSNLQEVSEPILGEVMETTAIVSSKRVYNIGNSSYAYAVSLVLLTGEDETTSVEYFCPRKTYDALNTAESVTVQYQIDSNGIVSVASVSR